MYSVFLLSSVKNCFKSKEFCSIPKDVFRDMKCCVQRIKKGFCYRDIWNIDDWFLNVIPDMLLEFRDSQVGIPNRFLMNNDSDERALAEWNAVLTQMAFLFREANEETCTKTNPYDEKYHFALYKFKERFGENGKWVKKKDGTRVFIQSLSDIPKYKALKEKYEKAENDLREYRQSCLKKAMSMFAEYFNNLWY